MSAYTASPQSGTIFGDALRGAASRSQAARAAEEKRASCESTPCCDADVEWASAQSSRVVESRANLQRLQDDLRAAPEGLDVDDIVLERNIARHKHINLLAEVLAEHDKCCIPARVDTLRQEAEAIQEELLAFPSQTVLSSVPR